MTEQTELKKRVDALYLNYVFPVLATLRLGEDPAALRFERGLLDAAKAAGIKVRRYLLPGDVSADDLKTLIGQINGDFLLSAVLLERPLPGNLDAEALEALIAPNKALKAAAYPELLSRVCDAAERNAK